MNILIYVLIIGLLIVGAATGAYRHGVKITRDECKAAVLDATNAVIDLTAYNQSLDTTEAVKAETQRGRTDTDFRELQRKLSEAQNAKPSACVISDESFGLLNAAIRRANSPTPAASATDSVRPITTSPDKPR